MSRIKGRYVAQVILEVDMERCEGMLPLEVIRENMYGITDTMANTLIEEGDFSKVEVVPQFVDVYETEEEE
jgi:hypothetical protein